LSFCYATYLHIDLLKMLMQFWRHATKWQVPLYSCRQSI